MAADPNGDVRGDLVGGVLRADAEAVGCSVWLIGVGEKAQTMSLALGENDDTAGARAAQAVALRSAGAKFPQIGIELGVSAERARQLYNKGLRLAKQSSSEPARPSTGPLSPHKALALPRSLLSDLSREGFQHLSWYVLRKVHLALPSDPAKGPQTVAEFADLMIAGVENAVWGAQIFNVQPSVDVLAWAEPRGSGTITISDERRAQLERAILARQRRKASEDQ